MTLESFDTGESYAQGLDREDELARYRQAFSIPDPNLIYLDGNSLGRAPKSTLEGMRHVIDHEWGRDLIRSWNRDWFDLPATTGDRLAPLLGAREGEVIVGDSTSVNLFKLAMAALMARPERPRILTDTLNFPSDLYVLQGCVRLMGEGRELVLLPSPDGIHGPSEALLEAVDSRTALVTLSHATFKSGYLYDMRSITAHAHRHGALVLWDLSHSAGVIPMELHGWGVDMAVGCTYKYLNGGPGSPAFLFVRRELQSQLISPIWGWFGGAAPFDFELDFRPAEGIQRFLVGTPPILSLAALDLGLDLPLEAGIPALRRKSRRLTEYLIRLFKIELAPLGFRLGSPSDPERRGAHLSLRHEEGYRINRALIEEMSLLPDFREPDNLRLGLSPLYTSYLEVWQAVQRIRRVLEEGLHLRYSEERQPVT